MLEYQKALLERRGYKVLTADSARQGVQIAAVCAIAAVILDYHMPEMNGGEVATEIRRLRHTFLSSCFRVTRFQNRP